MASDKKERIPPQDADDADRSVNDAVLLSTVQTKRPAIPQHLRLRPAPRLPRAELEPVEVFVKQAVDEFTETSDSKNYRGIVEAFRGKADVRLLVKVLVSFCSSGALQAFSTHSPKHLRLVHVLVRFNPFVHERKQTETDVQELVDAHFAFLSALATVNTIFAVPVLTALWKLLPVSQDSETQATRSAYVLVDIGENKRYCCIHAAIAQILDFVPSALRHFEAAGRPPHHRSFRIVPHFHHAVYAIRHYCPDLESMILTKAIYSALDLDVEIRITDLGHVQIEKNEEKDNKPTNQDKEAGDGAIVDVETVVDDMAEKLDQLMLLLFQYFEQHENQNSLYDFLANAFNKHIVNTHKSKFVQFLLLVITSRSEVLYRDFLRRLLEIVVDHGRATVTRQTAACYAASFVSRSVAVSVETAQEAAIVLLRCAETYIEQQDGTAADDDDDHSLFYAICQAAFYIICFRGTELLPHPELGKERWNRLCQHKLRPLQHCLETVREEFLSLALGYDLLNEIPQQPQKKRRRRCTAVRTPAVVLQQRLQEGVGGLGRGTNPLDSFFPFDPYLLRESYQYIEPLYRHWDGGNTGEEREETPPLEEVLVDENDTHVEENEEELDEDDTMENAGEKEHDEDEDDEPQRRKRLLSVASNATSVSSAAHEAKRPLWQKWQDTLQRSRASSIETYVDP